MLGVRVAPSALTQIMALRFPPRLLCLHRYAPQDKVAEIQKRCGLKPHKLRLHKGIRTRGAAKGF